MRFYLLQHDDGQIEICAVRLVPISEVQEANSTHAEQDDEQSSRVRWLETRKLSSSHATQEGLDNCVRTGWYTSLGNNKYKVNRRFFHLVDGYKSSDADYYEIYGEFKTSSFNGLKKKAHCTVEIIRFKSLVSLSEFVKHAKNNSHQHKYSKGHYLSKSELKERLQSNTNINILADNLTLENILGVANIIHEIAVNDSQDGLPLLSEDGYDELKRYFTDSSFLGVSVIPNIISKPRDKLNDIDEGKQKTISDFVYLPMYIVGEFFKVIFASTLGFEWFINLSRNWTNSYTYINPLTIKIIPDYGIAIAKQRFRVNGFNFWAVGLNIFFRNLGKLIGYTLSSIYAIPSYITIRSYYALKTLLAKRRLRNTIKYSDHELISEEFLRRDNYGIDLSHRKNQYYTSVFAKHVDSYDFLAGRLNYINYINLDRRSNDNYIAHNTNHYIDARRQSIKKHLRRSKFKLVLSGLFIVPLLWTIPKYKEQKQAQETELEMLDIIAHVNDNLNNPSDIYDIGMGLLDEAKVEYAVQFLAKVRPDHKHYREAMMHCASYYITIGEHEVAHEFSIHAKDKYMCEAIDRRVGKPLTTNKDTRSPTIGQQSPSASTDLLPSAWRNPTEQGYGTLATAGHGMFLEPSVPNDEGCSGVYPQHDKQASDNIQEVKIIKCG